MPLATQKCFSVLFRFKHLESCFIIGTQIQREILCFSSHKQNFCWHGRDVYTFLQEMQILVWELKQEKYHRSVEMGANYFQLLCFTCVAIVPSSSRKRNYRLYLKKKKIHKIRTAFFLSRERTVCKCEEEHFFTLKTRYFNGKDNSLSFYAAESCKAGKLCKKRVLVP